MALLKLPQQNITFEGPDDGSVWTNGNKSTIFKRVGNTIYQVNLDELAFAPGLDAVYTQLERVPVTYSGPQLGYTFINRYGRQEGVAPQGRARVAEAALKNQGIDLATIPQQDYNDLPIWFQAGIFQSANATTDLSALSKPAQNKGPDTYVVTASPDNPQGIKVTNETTGQVVNESPSLQESLTAAGATPEQVQSLTAAQQGGQPVTPEQAAAAGIPTSSPVTTPTQAVSQPATQETVTPSTQVAGVSASTQITPPTANLQPGQSGAEVAQLQQWLISQGYDIPAISSGSTQPGFFGDQTRAALVKWQTDKGVDVGGNPGFYGPKTMAAIQGTQIAQNTQNSANPSSSVQTPSTGSTGASGTFTTPNGTVVDGSGNVVTPASASGSASGSNTATSTVLPSMDNTQYDEQFKKLLANPNLTSDQRKAIEAIFQATSTNDQQAATRFLSAMNASTEFSSPYFKAQSALATDALTRGLQANDGDLSYKQNQLSKTLEDLRENTTASLDQLDFTHQQELKNLAVSLEKDLQDNAQGLAATGKTASSIRARTDKLLSENTNGLVESSNRKFSFDKGNLMRDLDSKKLSTSTDIAYLKDKNTQDRIAKLRETEAKVGSDALAGAGFTNGLFGGVFGSLPQQQQEQAISAGRLATGNPSFLF